MLEAFHLFSEDVIFKFSVCPKELPCKKQLIFYSISKRCNQMIVNSHTCRELKKCNIF